MMSKEKRAFSAQETLATMERGFYVAPSGQRVSVAAALRRANFKVAAFQR